MTAGATVLALAANLRQVRFTDTRLLTHFWLLWLLAVISVCSATQVTKLMPPDLLWLSMRALLISASILPLQLAASFLWSAPTSSNDYPMGPTLSFGLLRMLFEHSKSSGSSSSSDLTRKSSQLHLYQAWLYICFMISFPRWFTTYCGFNATSCF